MSWLHCVVSRKKSLMSFRTTSRFATGRNASSVPTVHRHSPPRTNRSAPSCAFVNPVAYSCRCSSAPSVTAPAAVVQSKTSGRGSMAPCRDRKSTRLNSSHQIISYAVFCLKKKNSNLQHGADGQCWSYTHVFRNGAVEGVKVRVLTQGGGRLQVTKVDLGQKRS